MERITIEVETTNAAFGHDPTGGSMELGRILDNLAARFRCGTVEDGHPIRDANGNTVGRVQIEEVAS